MIETSFSCLSHELKESQRDRKRLYSNYSFLMGMMGMGMGTIGRKVLEQEINYREP